MYSRCTATLSFELPSNHRIDRTGTPHAPCYNRELVICASTASAAAVCPAQSTRVSREKLLSRAAELKVEFVPLHRNFGAEVLGVNLTKEQDEATKVLLIAAMQEYDTLLFRGQELHPRDEERFLTIFPHDEDALRDRRFCNAIFKERIPDHPLIVVRAHGAKLDNHFGLTIEGDPPNTDYRSVQPFYDSMLWHQDKSDDLTPPEISSMYMIQVPSKGGLTVFASAVTAYSNLPIAERQRVRKLRTINARVATYVGGMDISEDGIRRLDDIEASIAKAKEKGVWEEQQPNPFVVVDPATGKESILFGLQTLYTFEGMDRKATDELLTSILARATAESEVYQLEWRPHDFAVWANRRIMHSSTPRKHYLGKSLRLYHLVFLDSTAPLVPADESLAPDGAGHAVHA
ncbi:hypothetical protein WJX72_006810 [[Myrmecia] bisecta]|uniref:TauD/TfdA-like domain-containing protein n=1 Tax=[Myrmecia] bisecta TaxID=41462 RepID=A0AAW1PUM2_9CHLO